MINVGTKNCRSINSAKITNTQKDAISYARNIAINNSSEVVIHGRDGKIRDKNSYGNDPFPPKG